MYLSSGRYPLRVQGDTLGEPVTLILPKREKKLTLAYRCGEKTGTIGENTTQEEITWTPPLELAETFPEKSTVPIVFVLTAPDGSRREERWELKLSADILPELQLEVADGTSFGAFVQGPGRLRATAKAQGKYGAEIQKILLHCGDSVGEGESVCFDLPSPGEVTVIAQAWDSRGRSAKAETTVTVLPWEPPKGGFRRVWEEKGTWKAEFWTKTSDVAGKNRERRSLVVPREDGEERQPLDLAQDQGEIGKQEGDRELILEITDSFATVRIPCLLAPFLDIFPEDRALGLGCRADRAGTVSLGLPISLGGNPLENLGQAQADTDALPLGQGDKRYLRPRLLWENESPASPFPAGSIPVEGSLFLIEAAPRADSTDTFWELGFPGGVLRAGEGASRAFAYTDGQLVFGTTEKGDGWAVPRKIYVLL